MPPRIRLQRGADRAVSTGEGLTSRHGLSFGAHYDPERTSFGALVAHNDDVLDPGVSYGVHDHRDVEILAWVVDGELEHRGPDGETLRASPGTLQQLVAGTGWRHDEASVGERPLHVVQMWLAPGLDDPPPGPPSLRHLAVPDREPVALHRGGATLTVARPEPGAQWSPPEGQWHHVHVTRGSVSAFVDDPGTSADIARSVDGRAGDSVEITGGGLIVLTPGADGVELLVVTTRSAGP